MTSTGFENYAEALKIYLGKYREVSSSSPPTLQSIPRIWKASQPRGVQIWATILTHYKSQTQRGDNHANQQRPGSSYGANQSASAAGASNPQAGFPGGQDDQILSPQGLDPSQQEGPYGGVYQQGSAGSNGMAGEPY